MPPVEPIGVCTMNILSAIQAKLIRALFVAAVSLVSFIPSVAAAEPTVAWRVENPFRFFDDPASTEMHRATWVDLTEEERRTPVLAAERLLASRHSDGWASTIVGIADSTQPTSAAVNSAACWPWAVRLYSTR